jgi:hypothetical protein
LTASCYQFISASVQLDIAYDEQSGVLPPIRRSFYCWSDNPNEDRERTSDDILFIFIIIILN